VDYEPLAKAIENPDVDARGWLSQAIRDADAVLNNRDFQYLADLGHEDYPRRRVDWSEVSETLRLAERWLAYSGSVSGARSALARKSASAYVRSLREIDRRLDATAWKELYKSLADKLNRR
jgi:hypothetical protein